MTILARWCSYDEWEQEMTWGGDAYYVVDALEVQKEIMLCSIQKEKSGVAQIFRGCTTRKTFVSEGSFRHKIFTKPIDLY